jgi:hypothetical protein
MPPGELKETVPSITRAGILLQPENSSLTALRWTCAINAAVGTNAAMIKAEF